MAEGPRIVFMGTPEFAGDILEGLIGADWNIVGVYTQPDSQAGRGLKLNSSPVSRIAQAAGLPVFQPASFRNDADVEKLRDIAPDFLVVASYGLILPQKVLDIPGSAPLNVHASLLPKYRGAAPIQHALLDSWQCDVTGVSLMRMVRELDAGPVYATREVSMRNLNAESLAKSLAQAGLGLLLEKLPEIAAGKIIPRAQAESEATFTRKLTKADGMIDWSRSAAEIDALVRAMNPWPGARTVLEIDDQNVPAQIRSGSVWPDDIPQGQILHDKKGLVAGCGTGSYRIEILQPDGRKRLSARDFANGRRLAEGLIGKVR